MSPIATRLQALPQAELDALLRAADALTDTGLAVVGWMREAASAEEGRRRGDIAVIPPVPHADQVVGILAVAAIVAQFEGRDEFKATVAFFDAVAAELRRWFQ